MLGSCGSNGDHDDEPGQLEIAYLRNCQYARVTYESENLSPQENLLISGIKRFPNMTVPPVKMLKPWYATKVIHGWITRSVLYSAIKAMKLVA